MRDYFASIIEFKVTGVTKGDGLLRANEAAVKDDIPNVTLPEIFKSDSAISIQLSSPLVTSKLNVRMPPNSNETALFCPSPAVTVDNEALQYMFEERAAIYQFDAGKKREDAELQAFKDVFGSDSSTLSMFGRY